MPTRREQPTQKDGQEAGSKRETPQSLPAWGNQEDPEEEPKVGGGSEGISMSSAESGLYFGFN